MNEHCCIKYVITFATVHHEDSIFIFLFYKIICIAFANTYILLQVAAGMNLHVPMEIVSLQTRNVMGAWIVGIDRTSIVNVVSSAMELPTL